jgi:putative phosphoribosyl transferase
VTSTTRDVILEAAGVPLAGTLALPSDAVGLVLFAHGSGSSRHSPRNRFVAGELQQHGLATLLLDLLTEREERVDERTASLRFDIPFLARRLAGATDWTQTDPTLAALPLGYFGASTGAAAALLASADRPRLVKAVVSRGGRPDLAVDRLSEVVAPTLLIVGGADPLVAELNQEAYDVLRVYTEARLEIVSGATHLFEEPGALEVVADLAARWFVRHLSSHPEAAHPTGAGTHFSSTRL